MRASIITPLALWLYKIMQIVNAGVISVACDEYKGQVRANQGALIFQGMLVGQL